MDDGRIGDEMTLEGLAKQLAEFRSEIRAQISSETDSVRADIKTLDQKMKIEFEETRRLINLGFESTQMLREEVGRRFDDSDRAHADHKSLIEAAVTDLRRDVNGPGRV